MPMKKEVIVAEHISKEVSLGGKKKIKILNDISLTASDHEFLSIVGPSGSGKSTLLQCLSGLSNPSKGTVQINDRDPYQLRPSQIARMRRQEIGYIFQSYNLLPALPVFENIVLPLRLSGKKVSRQAVIDLLKRMKFTPDLKSFVANLSGGEQQKVAIARVLMTQTKIIFADEPTGAVDSASKEVIFQLLRDLADAGACVVMVTHDIELAARTDRTITLKDGAIKKMFNQPRAQDLLLAIEEG